MARYLVVANQTATSPHLLERLREIGERDGDASFTLVVPETHVSHLLLCDEQESLEYALRQRDEAERMMREAGVRLDGAVIGNPSPLAAIADELRRSRFDAIVLSTLGEGRSRWLATDVYRSAARRFNLPIIQVVEGASAMAFDSPPIPPPPPREPVPAGRSWFARASDHLPVLLGAMAVYLVLMGALAVQFDRLFFLGDAVAAVVFAGLLIGIWSSERVPRI